MHTRYIRRNDCCLLVLLGWLLCYPALGVSQENRIDQYFDDKGISNTSVVIKTNLSSMTYGEFPLIMEFRILRKLGIEVGGGPILINKYGVFDRLVLWDIDPDGIHDLSPMTGGYGWRVNARYYAIQKNIDSDLEGLYGGVGVARRTYTHPDGRHPYLLDVPLLIVGYQGFWANRLSLDTYIQFGPRTVRNFDPAATSGTLNFDLAGSAYLAVQIGIHL